MASNREALAFLMDRTYPDRPSDGIGLAKANIQPTNELLAKPDWTEADLGEAIRINTYHRKQLERAGITVRPPWWEPQKPPPEYKPIQAALTVKGKEGRLVFYERSAGPTLFSLRNRYPEIRWDGMEARFAVAPSQEISDTLTALAETTGEIHLDDTAKRLLARYAPAPA
ncbi:MAG: hypothetical protein QOG31_1077 [Thermoplasmata archaeon]|jgi:hypothetical protein|nr:hypothetical protein [Thermoplasmata archaeon]